MRIFGILILINLFCFNFNFSLYGQGDKTVYENVPQMPRFPGCENLDRTGTQKRYCAEKKMREYVEENMLYPKDALENSIGGEVVLSFIVEKNGSLSNIKTDSGPGFGCEEEAVRLASLFPDWIPGRKKGKKVRVKTYAVLTFALPSALVAKKTKKNKKERGAGTRKLLAKERIQRLKDGVLIVRLQSKKNKIGALERLVKNASTDAFRQKTQTELDRTIFVRDSINQELVTNFSKAAFYNFSEVLFMNEADADQLTSGKQNGYFLNSNMEIDPSVSLDNREYFVTYLGTTPRTEDARTVHTAFVILDSFRQPLSWPFPTYIEWRKRLLNKKDKKLDSKHYFSDLSARDAVIKFSQKMHGFYEKTQVW